MRFNGLDLNLLVAFDVLLSTRSVSRAAEQLNLSQPAVSAALARLRDYFGDEILVIHGKRMLPTAFAESLRPQVLECLKMASAVIATSATFDPATSQRTFRIVASDYAVAAVLTPLIQKFAVTAPNIGIDIHLPEDRAVADLDEGKVDMIITPEEFISSAHPTDLLFEETHVVVGWRDNPLMQTPIDVDSYFAAAHISVLIGRTRAVALGDQYLAAFGRRRRIEIHSPSFTLLPWLVLGNHRLALMHERLARLMATRFPIAIQPTPFELPTMREMAQYHRARAADEGLRWLRGEVRAIAAKPE